MNTQVLLGLRPSKNTRARRCETPVLPSAIDSVSADILDLYSRSFPLSERRSDAAILESLSSPHYRVLTRHEGKSLAAFALMFAPIDDDFALLEYLAVNHSAQGKGVGTSLVRDVIASAPNRHVLFEVEAESLGENAARRQRFYRRCGCQRIDRFTYILPLPNDPPAMELMMYPAQFASAADLSRWLRRIYRDVYQCPPTDPRLLRMISDLRR